jgi:uncharacterized protein
MKNLPSRFRRLDGALADLPLEEPMLLTELDGFLTALVVGPDTIPQGEWLQSIWGSDDSDEPPFDDPADVQWFVDAVMARHAEIVRDLTRGKPQPIFDTDDRNGDVLWEGWIDGFAEAVALRPESWTALGDGTDPDTAEALAQIMALIAIVTNETTLDSIEVNALDAHAPAQIVAAVLKLNSARARNTVAASSTPAAAPSTKIGRNDPCPCGSGNKFKRCCG